MVSTTYPETTEGLTAAERDFARACADSAFRTKRGNWMFKANTKTYLVDEKNRSKYYYAKTCDRGLWQSHSATTNFNTAFDALLRRAIEDWREARK